MSIDAAKFNELSISVGYARKLRKQILDECRAWCENTTDPLSMDGQAHRIMAAIERMMARRNPSAIRQLLNTDLTRLVQLANLALCSLILERNEQQLQRLIRDSELLEDLNNRVATGEAGVFNPEHQGDVERGASTADVVALDTFATEGNPNGGE